MPEAVTVNEITLTRIYDAPRRLVWEAWTEPAQLASWWGARGWNTPPGSVTLELRPGGVFRVGSVSEHGAEMTTEAVFLEVVAPERLVIEEPADDAWHDGAVTEVVLTDLGDGRTELTLRATIHTTDAARNRAVAGLAEALDRLAEQLA
jgi:uncharacterized protein YndB with AHSA1/START domain